VEQDIRISFLREMMRIRRFEERCAELYSTGKIRGFLHLYVGEEAIAAGTMPCLGPDDCVFATYREHGHALARGVPAARVMAEMFGKVEGTSRGRGGSMHIFDKQRRFFGGNAIVAGHLPLAAGMALADRTLGRNAVTVCFFGEGAVAEGEFHEAMNLASLWHLPVLFACENNLYAMGTALSRSEAQIDLCQKARSYGVRAETVDGMDVLAVNEAVTAAVRELRETHAPFFLEFRTYRFRAHSMFDAELYRDKREVEAWKEHDPIENLLKRLKIDNSISDSLVEELYHDVDQEISRAIAEAEKGQLEKIEDITRFVHTAGDDGAFLSAEQKRYEANTDKSTVKGASS
jgi:pyruvate dehydrogenase E1 component alpha subunit